MRLWPCVHLGPGVRFWPWVRRWPRVRLWPCGPLWPCVLCWPCVPNLRRSSRRRCLVAFQAFLARHRAGTPASAHSEREGLGGRPLQVFSVDVATVHCITMQGSSRSWPLLRDSVGLLQEAALRALPLRAFRLAGAPTRGRVRCRGPRRRRWGGLCVRGGSTGSRSSSASPRWTYSRQRPTTAFRCA